MDCDIIIIGAGVVGLSIARSISRLNSNIYVVEKNENTGMEISSRNSEVLHSGIYYPYDSLKAKLCVQGQKKIYEYCKQKSIPYKKTGKLVIISKEENLSELKKLKKNAKKNGVISNLLSKNDIEKIEPNVNAANALQFLETGIIDSHAFMNSLKNDSISQGVEIALKNKVNKIKKIKKGYLLEMLDQNKNKYEVSSSVIINSSGLSSYHISQLAGIKKKRYELSFWKGDYFWVKQTSKNQVRSLIYPLPERNISGLGIHTTIDISGRMKLGPDSQYLGEQSVFNYEVDLEKKELFFQAAQKYLPSLKKDDLMPDQSGIRPKLQKPGGRFRDFVIRNETKYGYDNFINLIGIESPGLTSSLAIGEYVVDLIH